MKNVKRYKNFLSEGNFIEDFLKSIDGSSDQKSELLKTEISNFDTTSFFNWLSDKIKKEDDTPIYVYNKVNLKSPFYVMSEFHDNSKSYGFQEDPEGNITLGGKKYSYCIFNCSKIDSFSPEFLNSDLNKILSKNSLDNKKTIIEVTNFSSLGIDNQKSFYDLVQKRKVQNYDLKRGEFFIFSDNSNSSKGGHNLSDSIPEIFPNVKFYVIDHKFSGEEENLS